jgi:hypothetical protein
VLHSADCIEMVVRLLPSWNLKETEQ